jgi:hypothetical protein
MKTAMIIRWDSVIRAEAMTLAPVEAAVPPLDGKSVYPRLWAARATLPLRGQRKRAGEFRV